MNGSPHLLIENFVQYTCLPGTIQYLQEALETPPKTPILASSKKYPEL